MKAKPAVNEKDQTHQLEIITTLEMPTDKGYSQDEVMYIINSEGGDAGVMAMLTLN